MAHLYTQRNPTPSMLLPALWSQKQAKQSHSSLQALNKLRLSKGTGTKNLFVLSRSRDSLPISHTHIHIASCFTGLNEFWCQLWWAVPLIFFHKNKKIYKAYPVSNSHSTPLLIWEISILDYYQTGSAQIRCATLRISPSTFCICIDTS